MGRWGPQRGRDWLVEGSTVVSRVGVLRSVDERLGIGIRVNGVHCQETWGIRKRVWKGGVI